MAFGDKELDILSEPQEKELEIVAPRKKAARPSKPSYKIGDTFRKKGLTYKVTRIDKNNVYGELVPGPEKPVPFEKRQAIRPSLPPSIPEQIQESKFKFDTTPFRETPEQYSLRSTPPEQLAPQERLRREESLAARAGKRLHEARPSTPRERREIQRIAEVQEMEDSLRDEPLGPGLFRLRELGGIVGSTLAEPFKSAEIETKMMLSGDVLQPFSEREQELAEFRKPLGAGTESGYDPLRGAFRAIAPMIPFIGRPGKPTMIGGEPFRGGARVGVRPPKRPTPPTPPTQRIGPGGAPPRVPLLPPPRPSLPSKDLDIFYRDLTGGNIAPYQGGTIVSGMLAETPMVPRGWERAGARIRNDLSFDLIPSPAPGKAPTMVVPDWVLETWEGRPIGGMNLALENIPVLHRKIQMNAPSPEHAAEAVGALINIEKASVGQGLQTISLIGRTQAESQSKPKYIGHETFHAGQSRVGQEVYGYPTTYIHDPKWALQDPDIQELMQMDPKKYNDSDLMAMEIPTYVAADQWHFHYDNPSRGVDFLYRYLDHVGEIHGPERLDLIAQTATLPPEGQEILNSARSTAYAKYRARLDQGAISQGTGQPYSPTGDLSGYEATGIQRAGDQGRVGQIDPGAQPSRALTGPARVEPIRGVTPEERESNRLRFIEGSQYQEPMYHGTDAETDFEVFQRQGDIGFHFGSQLSAQDRVTKKLSTVTWTEDDKPIWGPPELAPRARIGAYWLSAKNPLHVKDIFMSGNLVGTVENMIQYGYVENNTNIQSKIDTLKRLNRTPSLYSDAQIPQVEAALREDIFRQLESKGYDSFEYVNKIEDPGSVSVAVFRPTQIKSVHGNIGTYDPAKESVSLAETSLDKSELQLREEEAHREFSKINDKDLQRRNELIQEAITKWENSTESFKSILKELEATDPQLAEIRDQYEIAYFKWMDAERDLDRGSIGPPTITPAGRRFNRAKFLEKSAVKAPLYHGTSSPAEIVSIDPSKFDPNALYGPGFYMTQSPEVAAGEEGGYTQKEIRPSTEEYRQAEDRIHREEADRIGFNVPSDQRAIEYMYDTSRTEKLYRTPNAKLIDDLDTALINARERTDEWERNYRKVNRPHAYKLIANIERPFDIDAPVTNKEEFIAKAEEWLGEDAYKLRNLFRTQDEINRATTGNEVYQAFRSAGMDKEEINQMLQEMGYDGITHIGGRGKKRHFGPDEEAAINNAQEVGGKLVKIPLKINVFRGVNKTNYFIERPDGTTPFLEDGWPKDFGSFEAAQKYLDDLPYGPFDNAVEGHKVWIAFPNAQVKSDTGNIGTFDPRQRDTALAEAEPPEGPKLGGILIGDLVKSKSRGLEGKVTKTGSDEDGPWAEVTFNDGTTEELNLSDLTKVTPKAKDVTPKVTPGEAPKGKIVPSLPGPMKIRGTSLQVDKIGPGDEPGKVRVQFADGTITQFNLDEVRDRRGRKIKDPILYMIVKDPPIIGAPQGPAKIPPVPPPPPGREGPLYVPVVSNLVTKRLTEKFTELLFSNNIEMDATRPISEQVYLNVLAGKVRDDIVDQILGEEEISWEEFAQDALFSVSEGARTMAHYSHIVQRHWKRLLQENPGLIQKAIPPAKQIELMLDEMKRSILGLGWWRRLGRDAQKALLTQYSTAAVNYMSAVGRIPADAASSIIGAMMQQMMEGKGTWRENLVKAREAAEATLQSHVEVVRALNPRQIEELVRGQAGTEYAEHERIIVLLEKYFPDIHSKLFARTYGEEAKALEKIENYLPAARLLLPRVKNDAQRRQLDQDIEKYSKKLKIEKSNIMWLVRGPEWFLDQVLRPANFGEFLLRRPRFVGRLRLELMDRGLDLDKIIDEGTFQDIPEEALRTSLSDALEFTMNYEPRSDKDAPYIERYIGVPFIKMMNALGIVSLKFTAFPRAMFSAAKTMYEYTPLLIFAGARPNSPLRKVFWKETRKDPKTGEEYNPNPPGRNDYERVGKAIVGTFLLYLAWDLIDKGILDEDGKKLKTPIKGPDKRPVYEDVSRYKPIATHFQIAALIDRLHKGTMGDKHVATELYEIVTGMRRYEGDQDPIEILDATLEFLGGDSDNFHRLNVGKRELGEIFPAPFLTPLLNLRAVIATVDQDENLKKDLKGQGFWGPSIDKIPILRRSLPSTTYPLEPGPVRLSLDPAMAGIAGIQLQPGQNAVGEEFKRMGINVRNYLRSDPDPVINREQNRIFETLIRVLGGMKISSPEYQGASNVGKAAMLEELLMGENGIVSYAHNQALLANPVEAERRKLKGEVPGKYTRKITGVEKVLEIMGRGVRK